LIYDHLAVEGLGLPNSISRRICHDNAAHWFPGIVKNGVSAADLYEINPAMAVALHQDGLHG
jgi:hypothetical protein